MMEIDVFFGFQRSNNHLRPLNYFYQTYLVFMILKNHQKGLIIFCVFPNFMLVTKISFILLVQIFCVLDLYYENHFTFSHLLELNFLHLNFAIRVVFKSHYFILLISVYLLVTNLHFVLIGHFIQMIQKGFFDLFKDFVFITKIFKIVGL